MALGRFPPSHYPGELLRDGFPAGRAGYLPPSDFLCDPDPCSLWPTAGMGAVLCSTGGHSLESLLPPGGIYRGYSPGKLYDGLRAAGGAAPLSARLSAPADADPDTHSFADSDPHSHSDAFPHSDTNGDAHRYSDADLYTGGDRDPDGYAYIHAYPHRNTDAHAVADSDPRNAVSYPGPTNPDARSIPWIADAGDSALPVG